MELGRHEPRARFRRSRPSVESAAGPARTVLQLHPRAAFGGRWRSAFRLRLPRRRQSAQRSHAELERRRLGAPRLLGRQLDQLRHRRHHQPPIRRAPARHRPLGPARSARQQSRARGGDDHGHGFSLFNGTATWDKAGKAPRAGTPTTAAAGASEVVWSDDTVPDGAVQQTDGRDAWNWTASSPAPASGAHAHQSSLLPGLHEHFFNHASKPLRSAPAKFSSPTSISTPPIHPAN